METTRLSSKGQVIIPKLVRDQLQWLPGTEFLVIQTEGGVLLKVKPAFSPTAVNEVAGMFKQRVKKLDDREIENSLAADIKRAWRGRD